VVIEACGRVRLADGPPDWHESCRAHGNARRNRPPTGSIVGATSLDVISAGQLPDRRSRRERALRLVRPDRRRCAGHPSPRLSVCVGPFGQDEPYDGGSGATTGLSTNFEPGVGGSSTKRDVMWTQCGNKSQRTVLGAGEGAAGRHQPESKRPGWCRAVAVEIASLNRCTGVPPADGVAELRLGPESQSLYNRSSISFSCTVRPFGSKHENSKCFSNSRSTLS